jgi:hypothetical protein
MFRENYMPLSELRLNNTNRAVDAVACWRGDEGGILLSPPYQRGDVWGTIRRRNFIRSLLMGVPVPSLVVNLRMSAEGWGDDFRVAVIDGKQRITTILMFLDGLLSVPAEWFHQNHIEQQQDGLVRYSDLNRVGQRKFRGRPIPFAEARVDSLEQEAEIFELINFGGVPQGQSDLE